VSLEDDLSKMLRLPALDMAARVGEHLGDDASTGDEAFISLREIFLPIVASQHDALLRLAREIDALRAGRD